MFVLFVDCRCSLLFAEVFVVVVLCACALMSVVVDCVCCLLLFIVCCYLYLFGV